MQFTTPGLVLRATKTGESDRMLSLLTPSLGVISAMAKGSLRLKSKLLGGTALFCYSEFTLFPGKNIYMVDEAEAKEVFFGLHEDVEAMAVAMYLSEFVAALLPADAEADTLLRLLLNCLHFLSEKKRAPRMVKAVFELRALALTGFQPDVVACVDCARYEGGAFCFDTMSAHLFCAVCAQKRGLTCNLEQAALRALRHILFSEDDKIFSFRLERESLLQLSQTVQQYAAVCMDKPMKCLSFLETVLT